MKSLGVIKQIWRYPVKGMAGEQVVECELSENGLKGDRLWALRDVQRQEIQSCKFRPELLMCCAKSRDDGSHHIDITLPNGDILGSDEPIIHRRLSELVGHESTLAFLNDNPADEFFKRFKGAKQGWLAELKATFTRENNEPYPDFSDLPPEVENYVTVPGSFFLVSPFHMITTASLKYLAQKHPDADWDVRRFRPNIVVDTGELETRDLNVHSQKTSLKEQEWLDKTIMIANARVDCTSTAPRCGAITRSQQGLVFDASMLRTVVKEAEQNLGIYGAITKSGKIAVGDDICEA